MEEMIKITIIKIVKLNIIFSQPRFCGAGDIRLERDSLSPFVWRKTRAARVIERMI